MRPLALTVLGLCLTSFAFAAAPDLKELSPILGGAQLAAVLEKAHTAYDSLNDYRAIFHKQERSGAALGIEETLFFKFEKPFKLFMGWLDTHKKGLQVLYERGKHDNKLAIHKPGLLFGLASVVFLEQDSPWVREGSESYDIEDAGIGAFLQDLTGVCLKGAREGKLAIAWAGAETVDVSFPGSKEGEGYFAARVSVHFDPKTTLCDRMRLYDWKDAPMGVYAYEDLRLDIGREDEAFKKTAFRKLQRLYWPAERPAASDNFSGKSRPAR